MAFEMKVSPKGLVCIPQLIRDRLGIRPGQSVLVDERKNQVIITKARRNQGSYECLKSCPHDFEIQKLRLKVKSAKFSHVSD